MHPFLDYILKANLLLIFFGLFYLIFLKRETFYQLNRWYFIGSIMVSITAPLITFTKTVLVDPIPVEYFVTDNETTVTNEVVEEPSFLETIDLQQTVVYLILFISFILIIRKIYAVAKLYLSIKKLPSLGVSNIKITADNKNVYSFYQWIVVPENFFQWQNHKIILDHESIHLNQKHTFDLILIELVAAVFWFNPLVKVMQRVINTNLEFIVDQKMIETTESVLYQKNLLQFQTQHAIQFVNSYNASEIKNRILQLNSKKSTNMKKLKFLLATPALVAFFALFQIETVAQIKETIEVQEVFENDEVEDSFYVMIHSKYDDEYYKRTVKMLREKYNLNVTIDNLKRNKDGELTSVRILLPKSNTPNIIGSYKKDEPFSPFNLRVHKKNNEYDIKIVHKGEVGYSEVISDENNKNLNKNQLSEKEKDFFMLLDTVEKDLDILKNDRKTFDKVASKFPIVIDGVLMNKNELKKFDTSKIKSVHIDAGNPEKGTSVNLSTNDDDHSGSRMFTFKLADDNSQSANNKTHSSIFINGKESTEEELRNHINKINQQRKDSLSSSNKIQVQKLNDKDTHVTIKGIGSSSNDKIVYIVDGKEINPSDFRKIYPGDIERIDVLKDKKAIEKYGQKGKDDVLLITTKAKKDAAVQTNDGREFFEKLKKAAQKKKEEQEMNKVASLKQKREALKARELAMKQRNEVAERKEMISQSKKEREKSRQQLLKKRNGISEKAQQRRKELEEQREKLSAKRKETIVVSNKKSDKKLLNDDYKTLNDIFKDVNKTVKEIEDENFKITSVRASITREDGTKVELSEVY